jgi:hypothetical protein
MPLKSDDGCLGRAGRGQSKHGGAEHAPERTAAKCGPDHIKVAFVVGVRRVRGLQKTARLLLSYCHLLLRLLKHYHQVYQEQQHSFANAHKGTYGEAQVLSN